VFHSPEFTQTQLANPYQASSALALHLSILMVICCFHCESWYLSWKTAPACLGYEFPSLERDYSDDWSRSTFSLWRASGTFSVWNQRPSSDPQEHLSHRFSRECFAFAWARSFCLLHGKSLGLLVYPDGLDLGSLRVNL